MFATAAEVLAGAGAPPPAAPAGRQTSTGAADGADAAVRTKEGAKRRKVSYSTREAEQDARKGLKQVSINSFFGKK